MTMIPMMMYCVRGGYVCRLEGRYLAAGSRRVLSNATWCAASPMRHTRTRRCTYAARLPHGCCPAATLYYQNIIGVCVCLLYTAELLYTIADDTLCVVSICIHT